MRPTFECIPYFKKLQKIYLVRKAKKNNLGRGTWLLFYPFETLKCPSLKFALLLISSFHKINLYSFLWVWIKFLSWHIVMILSLLATMFIKLVICVSNFDIIAIEAYDLIPDRKIKSNETKKERTVLSLSHMVNDFISRNTPPNKFCNISIFKMLIKFTVKHPQQRLHLA